MKTAEKQKSSQLVNRDKLPGTGPDISVVVVSYNVKALLADCLNSIRGSGGNLAVEVFVVDNASDDGSPSMIKKRFPECTLIESRKNLGFSGANNLGLARARGRYVLLLNPDTVIEPDVFEKMAAYMDANPETGMVTCRLLTEDGSLDLACRRSFPSLWDGFCRASGLSRLLPVSRLFSKYNLTYLDAEEMCEVEAVNGAFMFVRKEALLEVGQLDEDYFMYIEDLDWCFRFRKAGWKIAYNPEATTVHLKGQSGKKRSADMINRLFESTGIFYRKHYFADMSAPHRILVLFCLGLWKRATLIKNSLRKNKRTRP